MAYVISVEARGEGQGAPPERRIVNTSRMTIGRGDECSVRLADPNKHVSRVHAVIDVQGTGHLLTVLSRVNPVRLNGTNVAAAESAPVKADDVIEVGDFAIQLIEVHKEAPTPGAYAAQPPAASPFDFGLGRSGDTVPGDDPFRALDDLMPAKPAPRAPAPGPDPFEMAPAKLGRADSGGLIGGLGAISHGDLGTPSRSTDPLAHLLESHDSPIRDVGGPTFNAQSFGGPALDDILGRSPGDPGGQPLVDFALRHPGGSSSIDHVQSINVAYNAPAVRADARPAPAQPARSAPPPPAAKPGSSADPFDGFDPFASLIKSRTAEARKSESQPVERAEATWLGTPPPPAAAPASGRLIPPEREAPPPAAARAIPQSEPVSAPTGRGRELAAFLEGAGLGPLPISDAEAEAFMRESGAILRAAVEGLIGLLIARHELKKEIRAEDRTMIASRDNNPLKLMTEVGEAMRYLFDARERMGGAFLPPVQAVNDACEDLRVHDLALMAGMRAAFQGALKRFAPQYIEREADKVSGSFTLNKKVKLWDAFVAHHDKLSRDADDDLLKVFGKEFLGTYMAQVRRLRTGR